MVKSIHILLIIEGTWPWYRGGVCSWIDRYINAFPDFKFRVLQIATDEFRHRELDAALYPVPSQVEAFQTVPVPSVRTTDGVPSLEQDAFYDHIPEAWTEWADVLHVTNTGFAGALGADMAESTGLPLVLTEHALYWKEIEAGTPALECGFRIDQMTAPRSHTVDLFRQIAQRVYAASDRVISVSSCNIEHQRRLGAENPALISNGVDAAWIKKKLSEPNDPRKPVIGWVGRCADMKHPLRFIDFAEQLLKSPEITPTFIMLLAGAGESGLEASVQDRVNKLDPIEVQWNKDARPFYDRMDALCITSRQESQPLVMWEAPARGVVPFGWKAGDMTGDFGFVKPQDTSPSEMAAFFLEVYRSGVWCDKRIQLLENVRSNHTWRYIFGRYREIMEVLAVPNSSPSPAEPLKS